MTTITAAHPHDVRIAIAKAATGTVLLAAASVGVWHGTQALIRHYTAPNTTVSYASPDAIAATLQGAWHTPAKQGAFLDGADISTGNVRSVVVVVTP